MQHLDQIDLIRHFFSFSLCSSSRLQLESVHHIKNTLLLYSQDGYVVIASALPFTFICK